jgi:pentose-5-phosphate-3-epimerase
MNRIHAVKLAPSILAADFARLAEQVVEAERAGADRIHVDVMDGHFVPNLSLGAANVESLRRVTHVPLEAHLMIQRVSELIDPGCEVEVDGGIDATTVPLVVGAGATVLIAGSAIFRDPDGVTAAMMRLQAAINQHEVEEAWRIVDPILNAGSPPYEYEPGTWGPREVERLVSPPGGWHNPTLMAVDSRQREVVAQ